MFDISSTNIRNNITCLNDSIQKYEFENSVNYIKNIIDDIATMFTNDYFPTVYEDSFDERKVKIEKKILKQAFTELNEILEDMNIFNNEFGTVKSMFPKYLEELKEDYYYKFKRIFRIFS